MVVCDFATMSLPPSQQRPPVTLAQQSYSTNLSHGSIGPVIAVLVVMVILGVIAVMVGRLCSTKYDLESLAEIKCSSCIDGRINSTAT